MKVITSTTPTAQYMGAVAIRPTATPFQSGIASLKRIHTSTGKRIRIPIIERFQIVPSLCTESMYERFLFFFIRQHLLILTKR